MGQLETDDGVIDQLLAEGAALVGVFDGFFVTDSREADALDDDADTLMVEVRHDNYRAEKLVGDDEVGEKRRGGTFKALVLLANQVLNWNLDILKCNVRRAR